LSASSSNPEARDSVLPDEPVALVDASRVRRYRAMRTRPRGLLLLCADFDFLNGDGDAAGFDHFLDTARFVTGAGAPAFDDGVTLRLSLERAHARGAASYAYPRAALASTPPRGANTAPPHAPSAPVLRGELKRSFSARLDENPLFAKATQDTVIYINGQYVYLVDGVCRVMITRYTDYDEATFFPFRIEETK